MDFQAGDISEKIFNGVLWYLAFLLSITLHEASHAFTAMRLGDLTAYQGGHVTLDPVPHIRREPMGTVVVPIISYILGGWMIGWASVPYNPEWALQYPRRAAIMSVAGPVANFLLFLLAGIIIRTGVAFDVFVPPESIDFTHVAAAAQPGFFEPAATFLSILFSLNLLLLLFNLLPLPPMDGSSVLPLFLSEERARRYLAFVRRSSFAIFGLIVAWKIFGYVYGPIHLIAINLLYPGSHYR